MGQANTTASGQACMRWDEQAFQRLFNSDEYSFPDESISSAENFCRNPNSDEGGVWCTIAGGDDGGWGYCNVTQCAGQYLLRI